MGYKFFNIQPVKKSFEKKLNEFVNSLGNAISKGEKIFFADNDITYTLKLQNERIKEKDLEIEYEVYKRDNERNEFIAGSDWKDAHYESVVCFKPFGVKRVVKRNGKKVYKDNHKCVLYGTMTDVLMNSHPEDDLFSCPNCGAVSTIAELQNGCPYCSTIYKMDDLFPKVTGYYFLDDPGIDKGDYIRGFVISAIICTFFLFIVVAIANRGQVNLAFILGLLIGCPIEGVVMGFFMYSYFLLIRLIVKAIASTGKMGTAGSRMRFEARMKRVNPEFSFEYFTSKAISLIKTAIYSKDEKELLFYNGESLDEKMKNIIDLNYGGALGLKSFKEEDGIVTVITDAFFDVLYADENKVYQKHQVFNAVFQRRVDIPVNFNFSMTRISCPTCGASYDATKNKFCPNCGNEYEITSDDWALIELKVKR